MTTAGSRVYRVLVVDDEDIVQSLVQDALENEGLAVQTCSSGEDALRLMQVAPVDLLITDIRMSGMSGTQLAELARELNPAVGVVFITGYASLTSAKDAIKQGALDYIMKPFELGEIRQAVQNALAKLNDSAAASSHEQLTTLSDLSHVLFAAGDCRSLVTSSLKFAMLHQKSEHGSVLFWDSGRSEYIMLTIEGETVNEDHLGGEPLRSLALTGGLIQFREPALISTRDDHPILQIVQDSEVHRFLFPQWLERHKQMLVVPVMRFGDFFGMVMLASDDDTFKVRQTDLKFLSIIASQLAITLENVSLLEEAQQAYARLKGLQDETIELEKMATRGAMSAEIGHELNNFLGVVAGNVNLLELQLHNGNYDKLDKYLAAVTTTLEKMKTFTANLMDLRPISSKKEVAYFDRIITEVVEYLRPQRRFREVEIVMPDYIERIPLLADTTQIQQLLYNLFHNAADATAGCETRRITVAADILPDGERFEVSIKDTGVGFDPELLAKAFHEKFTTKESGHGFGLVVCKRIIDNHGGELSVESAPGNGTRIAISFPLAASEVEAAVPASF